MPTWRMRRPSACAFLYLNAKNMLIRNEPASEGSVDEAAVYIRR
jgi:DNA repair protein RadC